MRPGRTFEAEGGLAVVLNLSILAIGCATAGFIGAVAFFIYAAGAALLR